MNGLADTGSPDASTTATLLRFRRQGFHEPVQVFVTLKERLDENARQACSETNKT